MQRSTTSYANKDDYCSSCIRMVSIIDHYKAIIALMTISPEHQKLQQGTTSTGVYAPEVRSRFNYDGAAQCALEDGEANSAQTARQSPASSPVGVESPKRIYRTPTSTFGAHGKKLAFPAIVSASDRSGLDTSQHRNLLRGAPQASRIFPV